MPLLPCPYQAPWWLPSGDLQTIVPSELRKVKPLNYQRERLTTPDGDFLDLDWARSTVANHRLVILCHGLEGNTTRPYMLGMAHAFLSAGWDVLTWNYRSCSGQLNLLPRFYHHGDTPDLGLVISHGLGKGSYTQLALVGFSLGGSLVLKYAGERGKAVPKQLRAVAAFSVPTDLTASEAVLAMPRNRIYLRRFLKRLAEKVSAKATLMPQMLNAADLDGITRFRDFDNRYTAPLHGFASAADYYQQASAGNYLQGICTPTLLVNAANDPFLAPSCFPTPLAQAHNFLHLQMPASGGHVGFWAPGQRHSYVERLAVSFVTNYCG